MRDDISPITGGPCLTRALFPMRDVRPSPAEVAFVRRVFDAAREMTARPDYRPTIIFFDETDLFLTRRTSASPQDARLVERLLNELSALELPPSRPRHE